MTALSSRLNLLEGVRRMGLSRPHVVRSQAAIRGVAPSGRQAGSSESYKNVSFWRFLKL